MCSIVEHAHTTTCCQMQFADVHISQCRLLARQRTQQWTSEAVVEPGTKRDSARPRSEVDRRLDSLIHQSSGVLRHVNRSTVLKLLRLFNLCDLGTNSADKDKAKQASGSPRRAGRPRTVQNAVDHSEVCTATMSWYSLHTTTSFHGCMSDSTLPRQQELTWCASRRWEDWLRCVACYLLLV